MTAPPARRVFFAAHNRNHVRIFTDAALALRAAGVEVGFAVIDGHQDEKAALSAAEAIGFAPFSASELPPRAEAGDVVVVGNDWGPKPFLKTLDQLKRRGALLIGMIEGARFAYANHYKRVHHLLCWGPSALDVLPGDKIIVGSPAIESAVRAPFPAPERASVLINYKFTKGAAAQGPDWARMCARAAEPVDANYLISAHPLNVGELGGLNLSHAPFIPLLNKASMLITRSSTAIYEALAARVNVIYFPIQDEWRAEFADPLGAFTIAENEADLQRLVAAHGQNTAFDDRAAQAFLARHVDINPQKPAPNRIADVILSKLREPTPRLSAETKNPLWNSLRAWTGRLAKSG